MRKVGLYLPAEEIERVKKQRTTFCQPRARTEAYELSHVQKIIDSVGQIFDVADEDGKVSTQAKLVGAFVTTFGNPDVRLLEGYGFEDDRASFQSKYREFWVHQFPEFRIED